MEWVSVKDRLPEEFPHRLQFVIVAKENGAVLEAAYNSKTKEFMSNFKKLNHPATHWMEMPPPPNN